MESKWKINYYALENKPSPIFKFIENQPENIQSKIYHTLNLLEEYGPLLKTPHVKKLTGTPLWELRILGQGNIRFFYVLKTGSTFVILHAFIKKTSKTPKKEISTALKRLKQLPIEI